MKKLLAKILLTTLAALIPLQLAKAQQNILVSPSGPVYPIARGLKWNTVGGGGTDNNYLFTPLTPQHNACLYVFNNGGAPHNFNFTVSYAGDPAAITSGLFTQLNTNVLATKPPNAAGGSTWNILASQPITFFVPTAGVALVEFSISGSSAPATDTADLVLIQTTSSSCVSINGFPLPLSGFSNLNSLPGNSAGTPLCGTSAQVLTNGVILPVVVSASNCTALVVEKGPRWTVISSPAAGSQASASRAAGAAGVRHVADCINFSAASTTAPALTAVSVNLRDGATGAGTIIRTYSLAVSATTGQNVTPLEICGLNLVGSSATAMTLEFSAAIANLIQAVSITGYDTN